jgi:hypothetical protein
MSGTCGYDHYCTRGVQSISRYHGENDYCVAGRRIHVNDDGRKPRACGEDASPAQVRAILLFELGKYADYIEWRATNNLGAALQPFDFAHLADHCREVL